MPLKLDLLPAISIETERTIELYQGTKALIQNSQSKWLTANSDSRTN